MKNLLKIALLALTLALMSGCSAQKRANQHIRKAVELCPELVQMKAHVVDTVLTTEPFADVATLKLSEVQSFDTIYAATEHGTVVVSLSQSDSSLRVGFVAAPQKIHYQDTITYPQVVLPGETAAPEKSRFWSYCLVFILGAAAGIFACPRLLRLLNDITNTKTR